MTTADFADLCLSALLSETACCTGRSALDSTGSFCSLSHHTGTSVQLHSAQQSAVAGHLSDCHQQTDRNTL